MMVIMIVLVLAVIATAAGVLYGFFRRLRHIEEELWGTKQAEAVQTAEAEAAEAEGES
jgi:flagellar basal body-associated protein FliL